MGLLYDIHFHPILGAFGVEIFPHEQTEQIRREAEAKRAKAVKRLNEEPYSLWFKNVRHYK